MTSETKVIPYWMPQLALLGLGLLLCKLTFMFHWASPAATEWVRWGLFWGFTYCFSLVALGKLILNPILFVFPLIRILFFGYCMLVTASFNPPDSLLVLAGFLGYCCCLMLVYLVVWLRPLPQQQPS